MSLRTFEAQTPLEVLLVEQALAVARELQRVADAAPDGRVLAAVESAAVPAGREFTRQAVEAASRRRPRRPKGGTGADLPRVRQAALAQAVGRPRRPDRRRHGAARPAVPDLPAVWHVGPPAGRAARPGRVRQPAGPTAGVPGRGELVVRPGGAHLKEFCGLSVCDNTIRRIPPRARRGDAGLEPRVGGGGGSVPGGRWGRGVPDGRDGGEHDRGVAGDAAVDLRQAAPGAAGGGRRDGAAGPPAPHVRVVQAGIRTGDQLGPAWRRQAARLGLTATADLTLIADGAKWIWRQWEANLPGAAGVLDVYHASEHLWAAARGHFGDGTAAAHTWAEQRRATLLAGGAAALVAELAGPAWAELRAYFEPHGGHTDYAGRLADGRSIGSGMVEGACKQVVGRRLKQTGARWKVRRVERMAAQCAVQASDQWDAYWAAAF
ncbi:MAG: hypothetical protein U0746_12275 [Gemmataceae bacterium]